MMENVLNLQKLVSVQFKSFNAIQKMFACRQTITVTIETRSNHERKKKKQ